MILLLLQRLDVLNRNSFHAYPVLRDGGRSAKSRHSQNLTSVKKGARAREEETLWIKVDKVLMLGCQSGVQESSQPSQPSQPKAVEQMFRLNVQMQTFTRLSNLRAEIFEKESPLRLFLGTQK